MTLLEIKSFLLEMKFLPPSFAIAVIHSNRFVNIKIDLFYMSRQRSPDKVKTTHISSCKTDIFGIFLKNSIT